LFPNGAPFNSPAHLCGLSPSRLLPLQRVFLPGHQDNPARTAVLFYYSMDLSSPSLPGTPL